ncbi:DUF433 domain-containing protein [Sediminicoccus sp. KRV36]|uniref:DUF433 domain-containing protein n=1 Tax=Sediminicoccus sp. KRV36 TaxID=3133721 RepID=UPI0020103BF6|nr:DUF433 domain-containing protein [Sediminicoccus rosea]UPY36355.1 DUF433 domain-containing protein [Sediminicoccus rosea]
MTNTPRILLDPAILAGQPMLEGTRFSASFVLGLLAAGWSEADFTGNHPGMTPEHVRACFASTREPLPASTHNPSRS